MPCRPDVVSHFGQILWLLARSVLENFKTRAQFHRAAKHNNLLSMTFFCLDKNRITNQTSTGFSGISKQQLNTCNKQYATNEKLVGNPVFIREEISC